MGINGVTGWGANRDQQAIYYSAGAAGDPWSQIPKNQKMWRYGELLSLEEEVFQ